MAFFSKLFPGSAAVPEWAAGFFNEAEYAAFIAAVEGELRRRDVPYELGNGGVTLQRPDRDPEQLGLQNLAQLCHQEPEEKWGEVIERHFDNVARSNEESAEIDAIEDDFGQVQGMLKVRLFNAETVGLQDDRMVSRTLAPGIAATLVYDLPSAIRSVARRQLGIWGRSEEELFTLALRNVAEEPPPEEKQVDYGDATIRVLLGDSFFTATEALRLEHHLEVPAPNGVLVAVPHRHAVLFHAIRDLKVIQAISGMVPMAFGMFREGPGSISPSLYWWRRGTLTLLPSTLSEHRMEFTPPDAFVAMLNTLAERTPRGPLN